jgi:hypothetical protein
MDELSDITNKVSLAERDIEDFLWENPSSVWNVERWIARQMDVPSGRIDLLGVNRQMDPVVVEVKNVAVDSACLTQVSRYANDIRKVLGLLKTTYSPYIHTIAIGKGGVSKQVLFEANALGVQVMTFQIELKLLVTLPYFWSEESRERHNEAYQRLADSGLFQKYQEEYNEACRQQVEPEDLQLTECALPAPESEPGNNQTSEDPGLVDMPF